MTLILQCLCSSNLLQISFVLSVKNNPGLFLTLNTNDICNKLLEHKHCKINVITTYASTKEVMNAFNKLQWVPDLCIFDEAHKTVGQKEKQYSLLLDDHNLKIKKRLFMTATPKIYQGLENKQKVLSMDDEKWYGTKIHLFNTRDAINANYLC